MYPKTSVVTDNKLGYGLQIDADVPPRTKVIEYVGEYIGKREFMTRKTQANGSTSWYFARVSTTDDLYIDAATFGNFARFINHSCQPNCELQTWYVDTKPRLMVVSKVRLPKWCILTLSYMDPTWGISCMCGKCDGNFNAPFIEQSDESYSS
jgi:hypothetical protein